MEKTILAKTAFTGVEPSIPYQIESEIKVKKAPFLVPGTEDIIFPDVYYPDIDTEKVRWIINGPAVTKRELNKAVIPIIIGVILYFLVWS